MESLYQNKQGELRVIKCNLPNDEPLELLANGRTIRMFRSPLDSPWERVEPSHVKLLLKILEGAMSVRSYLVD